MQKIGATWPEGLRLNVENLHETGDLVFVEWTQEGKLSNGKETKQRALNVFELHEGKVKSHRLYTDSERIARDLGRL
jgi:ketosteroid isomerase-like protein